jgi:hypothetical protein
MLMGKGHYNVSLTIIHGYIMLNWLRYKFCHVGVQTAVIFHHCFEVFMDFF